MILNDSPFNDSAHVHLVSAESCISNWVCFLRIYSARLPIKQLTDELGPVTKLLRGPERHQCTRCSHVHIWSTFCPIMSNHLIMPKTDIMRVLLVTRCLRNSCMNFYPDWTKI